MFFVHHAYPLNYLQYPPVHMWVSDWGGTSVGTILLPQFYTLLSGQHAFNERDRCHFSHLSYRSSCGWNIQVRLEEACSHCMWDWPSQVRVMPTSYLDGKTAWPTAASYKNTVSKTNPGESLGWRWAMRINAITSFLFLLMAAPFFFVAKALRDCIWSYRRIQRGVAVLALKRIV